MSKKLKKITQKGQIKNDDKDDLNEQKEKNIINEVIDEKENKQEIKNEIINEKEEQNNSTISPIPPQKEDDSLIKALNEIGKKEKDNNELKLNKEESKLRGLKDQLKEYYESSSVLLSFIKCSKSQSIITLIPSLHFCLNSSFNSLFLLKGIFGFS